MPIRRDFILESGGLEYHALRYQPDTQPEEPMTSQDRTTAPTEEGIGGAIQQQPAPGA